MKNQTFTELVDDACQLFEDQPKEIGELIYWAVNLDDEARMALSFAYRLLNDKEFD